MFAYDDDHGHKDEEGGELSDDAFEETDTDEDEDEDDLLGTEEEEKAWE